MKTKITHLLFLSAAMLCITEANAATPLSTATDNTSAPQATPLKPSDGTASVPVTGGTRFFPLDRGKLIINHKMPVAPPQVVHPNPNLTTIVTTPPSASTTLPMPKLHGTPLTQPPVAPVPQP